MAIKVAVCVVGASLVMLGCAHVEQMSVPQTCTTSPCPIAVGQSEGCWPFNHLVLPDPIYVSVSTLPVTITWTLDSSTSPNTYFNPGNPIEFKKPEVRQYFRCSFDGHDPDPAKPRSYSCIDLKDTPKGNYEYSIRTKGWCSPPDKDPTVVNN